MATVLDNIPMGIYVPGNSIIHRLQARTKLLILVWFVVWIVLADHHFWHFLAYIALGCLAVGGIVLARLPFAGIWRRMWLIVVLLALGAVTLIFDQSSTNDKTLYTSGTWSLSTDLAAYIVLGIMAASCLLLIMSWVKFSRPNPLKRYWGLFILLIFVGTVAFTLLGDLPTDTLTVGPFVITRYGVWETVTVTIVLLSLFVFSLLLTMTTSPAALIEGLSMLLAPLRKLKLPVDDFALMALLALRFVPTLTEEVAQLMKAQAARGSDIASGTLRERLQSLMILFSSLVQGVLRRAEDLATALEARGYRSNGKQTPLYETSFKLLDYMVLGCILVLSIGSLLW